MGRAVLVAARLFYCMSDGAEANEEIALLKKQLAAAESFATDKVKENQRLEAENKDLMRRLSEARELC